MEFKIRDFANRFLDSVIGFCLVQFSWFSRNLNIIQVGANDGKSIDHMFRFTRQKKSKAIVVEPVLHVFEKLKNNYAPYPNVTPWQLAITDRNDEAHKTFYYLAPKPGEEYFDMYTLWGSFSLPHLETFKSSVPNFDRLLVAEDIPCISINKLIEESRFDRLHILATDTEGYDGKIIGSLDLNAYKPELIFFEHIHIPKNELFPLLENLQGYGYRCYSHGYDTICFTGKVMVADLPLRIIKLIFPRLLTPRQD
jgi:FkbM family methyltransferase